MTKQTVEINGIGNLSYQATAEAEKALVCLHGLGQSSVMWEETIARLPDGWQGFGLDMIGFGDSEKLESGYSIGLHAETVAKFIEQLPHESVVLAANSMGGVVAMTVAIEYAALDLAGLVLVSSGANVADKSGAESYRDELKELKFDLETARKTVRKFTYHEMSDELWTRIAQDMMKASHAALHETLTSSISMNLVPLLDRIAPPTVVIQGMEDKARTPEAGLAIAQGVQDGRLVVVPEAGHTPMIEVPSEFQAWLNAMLQWLDR